jgi:Na+/melibiose symporter-like transporter
MLYTIALWIFSAALLFFVVSILGSQGLGLSGEMMGALFIVLLLATIAYKPVVNWIKSQSTADEAGYTPYYQAPQP